MGFFRIGRWLARGVLRLRADRCWFRWVDLWRRSAQNDISLEIQKRVPPLRAARSGRDDNKEAKARTKAEADRGSLRCASGAWITSRRLRAGDPSASLGMTTERQKRSASRWSHISQQRRDMGHPAFGDPSTSLGMTTERQKQKQGQPQILRRFSPQDDTLRKQKRPACAGRSCLVVMIGYSEAAISSASPSWRIISSSRSASSQAVWTSAWIFAAASSSSGESWTLR
jgi:hypothetical protein